jgi:hypothetical protein
MHSLADTQIDIHRKDEIDAFLLANNKKNKYTSTSYVLTAYGYTCGGMFEMHRKPVIGCHIP